MIEDFKVGQDSVRGCFDVGQTVLVRDGNDWVSREIKKITVLRRNACCDHCHNRLFGEPRLWFTDIGNVPLSDVIAKEDIDPPPVKIPTTLPKADIVDQINT